MQHDSTHTVCTAADADQGPREVAEVLALTFERETAAGQLWCPPRNAAVIARWVTGQGSELWGALRRLVRLARALGDADGRSYAHFLYLRLPALRFAHFRAALVEARQAGRLDPARYHLTDRGLSIRGTPIAAPRAGDRESFEIDFSQMPRLAALLDVLHNALGFTTVADLLALGGSTAPARTDQSATRKLERAFAAWLNERLETRHHLRQTQALRAYLRARGAVEPSAITDNTILQFWRDQAYLEVPIGIDGFRMFGAAARAMLRFRQALHDAELQVRLANAEPLDGAASFGPASAVSTLADSHEAATQWFSPIAALLVAPANRVKWLTNKERLLLADYLGGYPPGAEPEDEAADKLDLTTSWATGLAGHEPFDLRFSRTLLRAAVFGSAQASVTARLRKRQERALATVLDAIPSAAYSGMLATYERVYDQVRLECEAALHILAAAGAPEALALAKALGGADAVTAVRQLADRMPANHASPQTLALVYEPGGADLAETIEDPGLAHRLSSALRRVAYSCDVLADDPARTLFQAARQATRRVNRAGFQPADDLGDHLAAFRCAALVLPDLLTALERLCLALDKPTRGAEFESDRSVFYGVLDHLYGVQADQTRREAHSLSST